MQRALHVPRQQHTPAGLIYVRLTLLHHIAALGCVRHNLELVLNANLSPRALQELAELLAVGAAVADTGDLQRQRQSLI